ncbi:S-layer homology domain-containing protein [Butyricicoccus sp. Marseille-Q5471]|uniref:S-layer homology domain-containing protein n=1 Tax=Butyricicoccus sp. Marseille-Q5471 TaxID=3039493 RepID=UPI0024BC7D31|nr:S-layer homology domain-containing protein [Butyricicoccus sp. Marseille-Q5471]
MKRKFSKAPFAVLLALSVAAMSTSALAATSSELSGKWYEGAMSTWMERGIIKGYEDGSVQPERSITRGEMAVVLDRVMDYQSKAKNSYTDLSTDNYSTDAILGASAAGVLKGYDDGTVRPNEKITREQAAVMLSRVMKLDGTNTASAGYQDQDKVSSFAVSSVNAMKAAGYMKGDANGNFAPQSAVTRAEIATVLDNIFKGYYNKAETYTGTVSGSAVINTSGVILKDMTITGNLVIAEGVANGDATLENVTVKGAVIVRGGGTNSIHITGNSSIANISAARTDGAVRIAVEGSAVVSTVVADNAVVLDGTIGSVTVAGAAAPITINGKVDSVVVAETAQGATLKVAEKATVGTLTISAPKTSVEISGTVKTVTTTKTATSAAVTTTATAKVDTVVANGTGTAISGTGKVANVSAAADNVKVDTSGTKVTVDSSASGVTAGGKDVSGGSSTTVPDTGSGSGSSGGGGGGGSTTTTYKLDVSITDGTKTVNSSADYQLSSEKIVNALGTAYSSKVTELKAAFGGSLGLYAIAEEGMAARSDATKWAAFVEKYENEVTGDGMDLVEDLDQTLADMTLDTSYQLQYTPVAGTTYTVTFRVVRK